MSSTLKSFQRVFRRKKLSRGLYEDIILPFLRGYVQISKVSVTSLQSKTHGVKQRLGVSVWDSGDKIRADTDSCLSNNHSLLTHSFQSPGLGDPTILKAKAANFKPQLMRSRWKFPNNLWQIICFLIQRLLFLPLILFFPFLSSRLNGWNTVRGSADTLQPWGSQQHAKLWELGDRRNLVPVDIPPWMS